MGGFLILDLLRQSLRSCSILDCDTSEATVRRKLFSSHIQSKIRNLKSKIENLPHSYTPTQLFIMIDRVSTSLRKTSMRFCAVLLLLSLARCGPPGPEAMLADACAYLWSMQDADGGWHSATHGLLRGGQAWTPFVLHTLLETPADACAPPENAVARALDFIRRHLNETGTLGLSDPDVLEYPNYATAYALRVLARQGEAEDAPRVEAMVAYLTGQQFAEQRGFGPGDAVYGGWGFGEVRLPPGRTGHVDLSHTRRVLQALHDVGYADPVLWQRAEAFLRLVQKHPADARLQAAGLDSLVYDGGFFASPVVPSVNKSAPLESDSLLLYGSYATATCDGLLALLAAGVDRRDDRVQAALEWLRTHDEMAYPQGMAPDHPAQWQRVMFYYHLGVRAEVYDALDEPGPWREAMVQVLSGKQRADGSFANPYGALNKEDDPILATALAVLALRAATR